MENYTEISTHPVLPDFKNHWKYKDNWQSEKIDSVNELLQVVTKKVWSPIVWSNGKNNASTFLFSDWGALDCDATYPIEQAKKDWCDTVSLITTTKSDTPEARCYRIIFPWEKRIKNSSQYVFNSEYLARKYDMDPSPTNPARWFWPGFKIEHIVLDGFRQPVLEVPENYKSFAEKEVIASRKYAQQGRYGIFPKNIKAWLNGDVYDGIENQRNNHCYKVGKFLTFWGMKEDAIIKLIRESKLPLSNYKSLREAENAARNGIRKARKIQGHRAD